MDFGFHHLVKSFRNSLSGLRIAYCNEQAFRHECIVLLLLASVLAGMRKPLGLWLLTLGAWLVVMAIELLNSAVERTCDLVSKDFNPLIKAAKDMASAAILMTICANAALWVLVFIL